VLGVGCWAPGAGACVDSAETDGVKGVLGSGESHVRSAHTAKLGMRVATAVRHPRGRLVALRAHVPVYPLLFVRGSQSKRLIALARACPPRLDAGGAGCHPSPGVSALPGDRGHR
jgi:hypothetical protein